MASSFRMGLLLAPMLGQEQAFRVRHRSSNATEHPHNDPNGGASRHRRGDPNEHIEWLDGNCASLYTWGAPMVTKRPHPNPRSADGCWKGLRMYNVNTEAGFSGKLTNVDIVPAVLHAAGWIGHPPSDVARINQEGTVELKSCSDGKWWDFETPSIELHMPRVYIARWGNMGNKYEWEKNLSNLAIRPGYLYGADEVAEYIRPWGWNIVGSAHKNEKVSHLLQDPKTLDCVITFQGTDRPMDWWDNLQFGTAPFCGLPESVHQGFRSQTRWMTQDEEWQNNIRPKLGKCRNVIATGHSLGGAMATLFTMCIAQAPPPSHPGRFDFAALGWHKETPELLEPTSPPRF